MAKKIKIDIEVNGKMQKATVSTKKLKDALDGVDKSQGKVSQSARTADRNIKGVAQASANGTKNFSKMAQGIGGTLVPAYAVLASNLFAVSAAFEFLKNAAQVEQLEKAQVAFAQNTGIALGSITTSLRNASNGLLGFREAAEAAAIGTAKGFSSKQLNDLADGAQRASVALGRNFTDSFDRLVRGISKAEPELLDELGITLRLEKATNDYAASLGITADALTDVQRSQAVLVATQKQLDEFFGNVPAGQNAFVKLSKTFEDIVKNITMGLLPASQLFSGLKKLISVVINTSLPKEIDGAALLYVSVLFVRNITDIEWDDISEAAPAILAMIAMPLTYSISNGIALAFVSYALIKLFTGKFSSTSPAIWVIAILSVVSFAVA